MKKKEKSAQLAARHADIFRCPVCGADMHVREQASLVCRNAHAFDFAKQGYVNMLNKPVKTQYDKALFEDRHAFITESGFYLALHTAIAETVGQVTGESSLKVLDAGSGEGSHLARIMADIDREDAVGVGVDIAKEGIMMAAKHYPEQLWLVGDLADLPIADAKSDVILNILSPARYDAFNRVLAPGGCIIKVVPGAGYLKELREALYKGTDKAQYDNADTVALFEAQYGPSERMHITKSVPLDEAALRHLSGMSPLAWNQAPGELDDFITQARTVTLDLEILIGRK
ncbi:hypothetical protein GCM10022378_08260 [Salinicoccus jeotgali]|uniref:Methyltransferase domain-containing protein n=1 Tax=Salinicoccus jeotgali TaxID=381634 RepID=A0ABP7ERA1_9STAP